MARPDLLSLTSEDLVVLSDRGLVKRAQQELDSGEVSFEWGEDEEGTVTVRWSDEVKCVLPADRTVSDGLCSCAATTVCRHLIRSVLTYQQAAAGTGEPDREPTERVEQTVSLPAVEQTVSLPDQRRQSDRLRLRYEL
jgi:hypothetical protein